MTLLAGFTWKNRANQERSGPAGGLSSVEGAGEALENSESSD